VNIFDEPFKLHCALMRPAVLFYFVNLILLVLAAFNGLRLLYHGCFWFLL
jgi:hypothetical protein